MRGEFPVRLLGKLFPKIEEKRWGRTRQEEQGVGDQPGAERGSSGQAGPNCSQRKDKDSRVTSWGDTAPALGTRSEEDEPALTGHLAGV